MIFLYQPARNTLLGFKKDKKDASSKALIVLVMPLAKLSWVLARTAADILWVIAKVGILRQHEGWNYAPREADGSWDGSTKMHS